jgi:cardiolipin synthase C
MQTFILTHLTGLLLAALALVGLLALLRYIYRPPSLAGRVRSMSLPPDPTCDLMIKLGDTEQHASHLSGIHILDDGAEAFVARRGMLRLAEHSIDAQYYMWHTDLTGRLLMEELLAAADRGVRVRLLLDDNTTLGTDTMLLAASSHPNVELRLFNPFILRKPRLPAYIFDLRRLNRRMHNKALIVDGVACIVGGRNIGDEYFNAHQNLDFADMDVLTVGAVVPAVAASFDSYWNSKSSFPLETVLRASTPKGLDLFKTQVADLALTEAAIAYREHISVTPLVSSGGHVDFDWVPVELVADDAAKGEGDIPRRKLLFTGLSKRLGAVEQSVDVVTAYFVPGRRGSTYLGDAAGAGKKVRVLTNSLASNDVVPVHAGYARYRKKLLRRGVSLYELRNIRDVTPVRRSGKRKLPRFGASSSSLHAKVFVLDKRRVFIGSFNFDPRSVYLNCEMGLLIDSEKLGHKLSRQMDHLIASQAYTPFLALGNRLSWRDIDEKVYRTEPGSTARQRTVAWVVSWLPIEWLL